MYLLLGRRAWLLGVLFIMGIGAAFSALHITAWNWDFPTPIERNLWRMSSLGATVACILVGALLPFMGTGSEWWQRIIVIFFIMPLWGLYMCARGILLVQVIICLRRMPDGVYQSVTWTSYIPHAS
jgi:hypothetical protein